MITPDSNSRMRTLKGRKSIPTQHNRTFKKNSITGERKQIYSPFEFSDQGPIQQQATLKSFDDFKEVLMSRNASLKNDSFKESYKIIDDENDLSNDKD